MTALKIDSVERNAGVKNCYSKDLSLNEGRLTLILYFAYVYTKSTKVASSVS